MYFTDEDWARTQEVYEKWWKGELERPLILSWACSQWTPQIDKMTSGDFSKSPAQVVDELDANIQHTTYYGDAFPMVNWDFFGPGCLAAYLGSSVTHRADTVWFGKLPGDYELSDLHFEFDDKNPWFVRCCQLYEEASNRWKGKVLLSMTDLGGVLDVLAHLIGTERLLYSVMDEPEEIDRLCKEIQKMWTIAYWKYIDILKVYNRGYADWAGLFSTTPTFTQQCDFSFMLGPDEYDMFVDPYLRETAATLGHTLYHMDGVGELTHFDKFLKIDAIEAIQWQPGDGQEWGIKWLDIYKKILDSGKRAEFIGNYDLFLPIAEAIGGKGFYTHAWFADEKSRNAYFDRFENSKDIPYRR